MDIRKGYKRNAPPPVEEKKPWITLALFGGEVRCPMKASTLGIESCAVIQRSEDARCRNYRCRFVGQSEVFLEEIRRVKKPAPKRGERVKRDDDVEEEVEEAA